MGGLESLALGAWRDLSGEGLLVVDATGAICLINARLCEWLRLRATPANVRALLRQATDIAPELGTVLGTSERVADRQWGTLRLQKYPPERLVWQRIPLVEEGESRGALFVFRDASTQGQFELAKQSFLSMISHDLRTPLSTILGFAELLYQNRQQLSDDEQAEFLEHIIKNANDLSRYTQIVLDIMFLEANLEDFETEEVYLDRFVRHWLLDARHRFAAEQIAYRNGAAYEPMSRVSPAALHRILYILAEFALAESPPDSPIHIGVDYDATEAHVLLRHQAPELDADEVGTLFHLLYPRDLSEEGRPQLHRMQLYVASLLAERQQGRLTLRGGPEQVYEFDLAVPLAG